MSSMFKLYRNFFHEIKYAKENDIFKSGTNIYSMPEDFQCRISLFSDRLQKAFVEDGGKAHGHCPSHAISPKHPCKRWSCSICAMHVLYEYFNEKGVQYD